MNNKYGDWNKVRRWLRELRTRAVELLEEDVSEVAVLTYQTLIEHIEKQDLDWEPLSDRTVALKGHDGAWVATGALVASIEPRLEEATPVGRVFIVGPKGTHPNGLDNQKLAAILEADRPLFAPTFEEIIAKVERKDVLLTKITEGF